VPSFVLATHSTNSHGLRSEKAALNQNLKKGEKNVNVPKEIQNEKQSQEQPTVADNKDEADALRIPPDPNVPSGILSVIIHQINNRQSPCCVFMLTNS
jgi:hypothetical protein